MRIDFWNNPLVVTAFRVKHRKGGLLLTPPIYMLALCAAGVLLEFYHNQLGFLKDQPTQHIFLVGLLGLQFLLSPILAAVATASSMRSEVANRTLDFQRIAALSPRQILVGKLLGEPALAYLLILATVPFAVWCWARGVKGLGSAFDPTGAAVLALLYLLLCSTTLLFGVAGLQHRLEITEGQLAARGAAGGPIWVWIMMSIWASVGHVFSHTTSPWYLVPAAILSPVLPLAGLQQEDPWMYCMPFFGWNVPYVALTPFVQLFVAFLSFECMARRLLNPLNTVLPRGWAYLALFLADVICAGAIYDRTGLEELLPIAAAFWLVHVLVALELLSGVTAWKESLHSWVWRYRRPGWRLRLRDLMLGQRSENTVVLLAFCLIGLAVFSLGVVLPARNPGSVVPALLAISATTVAALLLFGTLLQWTTFFAGRYGGGLMLGAMGTLIVAPHLAGLYYRNEWLLSLSLSAHYVSWLTPQAARDSIELHVWPMLVLLMLLTLAVRWHFRVSLWRLQRGVDHYLEKMAVPSALRMR